MTEQVGMIIFKTEQLNIYSKGQGIWDLFFGLSSWFVTRSGIQSLAAVVLSYMWGVFFNEYL